MPNILYLGHHSINGANNYCRVSSEHQLEVQGMELVNQNKLWAAIVFTNVPNDPKVGKV